jgi:uncharacterized protein YutE (UPF0331/DUF86 family)
MTQIQKDTLRAKIILAKEALADLVTYRATATVEHFRAVPTDYYAVCYRLIGAIEALYDIGQHLLLNAGTRATSQAEIPELLASRNIIPADLSVRLKDMYGFRNRLVHGYKTLNDERVSEVMQNNLGDIEAVVHIAEGVVGDE